MVLTEIRNRVTLEASRSGVGQLYELFGADAAKAAMVGALDRLADQGPLESWDSLVLYEYAVPVLRVDLLFKVNKLNVIYVMELAALTGENALAMEVLWS